jgi:hypothetical protein
MPANASENGVAMAVAEQLSHRYRYDGKFERWLAYDGCVWLPTNDYEIEAMIYDFARELCNDNFSARFLDGVVKLAKKAMPAFPECEMRGVIPMANGVLDIAALTLSPTSPRGAGGGRSRITTRPGIIAQSQRHGSTMSLIVLDSAGIVTFIGELEPTRMAQHMGMDREGEGGERPGTGEYSPDRGGAQGPAPLRDRHLGRPRVVTLQASERPKLGAPQGVGRGRATLLAVDMQKALGKVHLCPREIHELRDPQSMPVSEEHEGSIPMPMAPAFTGRLHQHLHLLGQEVLAGAALRVFHPPRR